jgi:hypothetical protein
MTLYVIYTFRSLQTDVCTQTVYEGGVIANGYPYVPTSVPQVGPQAIETYCASFTTKINATVNLTSEMLVIAPPD